MIPALLSVVYVAYLYGKLNSSGKENQSLNSNRCAENSHAETNIDSEPSLDLSTRIQLLQARIEKLTDVSGQKGGR